MVAACCIAFAVIGSVVFAGEEEGTKRPGLRMDDLLIAAAQQFSGGALPEGATVEPGISISGAADGYTIRRYAVVLDKEEQSFFFRVRTLIGTPDRDVAVLFAADGTLADAFDLIPQAIPVDDNAQAPAPGEGAKAATVEDAGAAKPEDIENLRKGHLPSLTVVLPMIGRHPMQDADSMAALLRGISKAETLVKAGGKIELEPLPDGAFTIENPIPKPGKPLAQFTAASITGNTLSNKTLARRPVAILFTALESVACAEMNQAVVKWVEQNPESSKRLILVVMHPGEEVKALVKGSPLEGKEIVCDPMNQMGQTFEIEVRPMLLIYSANHTLVTTITPDSLGKMGDALKGLK
jgi:hypothetical protein